jgi:SAM-dependent methyltransferase
MLSFLYDAARRLAPYQMRRWFKSQSWFVPVFQTVFGNDVYSESYFEDIERLEAESVEHISTWIDHHLTPATVVDVGCGPGHLMAALENQGVDTFGIDVSTAAIRRTRGKGLDVSRFDLRCSDDLPGIPYDLAVCCEVAEHLESQYARPLVRKLTRAAPVVYMTAAKPDGTPGLFHVNERENEYWISLMNEYDYSFDADLTERARSTFSQKPVISHLASPMIFRRS